MNPILLRVTLLFALIFFFSTFLSDRDSVYDYEYVVVYCVKTGDTLWNIAKQHSSNKHDVRYVIDEIMKINEISAVIHAGDLITIPVYKNMKNSVDK